MDNILNDLYFRMFRKGSNERQSSQEGDQTPTAS